MAAPPLRRACRIMVDLLALTQERACEAKLAAKLNVLAAANARQDTTTLLAKFANRERKMPDVRCRCRLHQASMHGMSRNQAAKHFGVAIRTGHHLGKAVPPNWQSGAGSDGWS
jgi:hypothetical protein